MSNNSLKFKRATLLVNQSGQDCLILTLDETTPFPIMGYEGSAQINIQADYGIEWCKLMGIEPEIIDMKRRQYNVIR